MTSSEHAVSGPMTKPQNPSTGFLAGLVALTFLMNAIGRGITEAFGVFLLPVEHALQVDRAWMSATYSIYMLAVGLSSPFVGQLMDRFGARLCYATGLIALGAGNLLGAQAHTIWDYYVAIGLLAGLGASALSMVVASSLLSRWFLTRMATVASIPFAAASAGMLVFPALAQKLMQTYDWRTVQTWQGVGLLALLPLLLLLPLKRYGEGSEAWRAVKVANGNRHRDAGTTAWTVRLALQTSAFWMLFLAYFLTSVAAYAVLPHLVTFLIERGFDPVLSAGILGLTGVTSTAGILLTGWLSDRFGRLPIVTMTYLITIAGILCLLGIAAVPSTLLAYGFVLTFGLMQGARGPILVAMVAKLFAGGPVGTLWGVLAMALGFGAGLGSWLSGLLHTWTGGYGFSFAMAACASAAGLATFWLAPSLRYERITAPTGRS